MVRSIACSVGPCRSGMEVSTLPLGPRDDSRFRWRLQLTHGKIKDFTGFLAILFLSWRPLLFVLGFRGVFISAMKHETPAQWLFGPQKNSFHYWSASRGPRGVKKSHFFFQKWKCFPFALRLHPKDTNSKKTIKIEEKISKKPVFLDIFEHSSILGQS